MCSELPEQPSHAVAMLACVRWSVAIIVFSCIFLSIWSMFAHHPPTSSSAGGGRGVPYSCSKQWAFVRCSSEDVSCGFQLY